MTLIVAAISEESIWLLADRRLSANGFPPQDNARKAMILETKDGVAILGYAGLGATARGTEPADWMSKVLRGISLPIEQSLGKIADAMQKHLVHHLSRLPGKGAPAHNVIIPAFIGDEPRLYTIDLAIAPDRKNYRFRYTRHVLDRPAVDKAMPPRFGIGGSGALLLINDRGWQRELLRLVRANNKKTVSSMVVADQLANLNYQVYLKDSDKTVGPSCIVAWRYKKGGIHGGGGGHQFYTGKERDASSPALPTIANGMDISALIGVIMPVMTKQFKAMRLGQKDVELDKDEMNARLASLPDKPDENLL